MFGLFAKKDAKASDKLQKQLVKDYSIVLQAIKKQRATVCQNKKVSLSEMGKDLAHIERKAKAIYGSAIDIMRKGQSADEAYKEIMTTQVKTELDQMILDSLLIDK